MPPSGRAPRTAASRALAALCVGLALLAPVSSVAETSEEAVARELAEQQALQDALKAAEAERTEAARTEKEASLRAVEIEETQRLEAAQRSYGSRIADELSAQESLLWQATGRGAKPDEPLMPTGDADTDAYLDPRVAPSPPVRRELPREIFDEERVKVPANRWGGRKHPGYDALRLELDADGDGRPELVRWIDRQSGELLREESDRNYDGTLDAWTLYRGGAVFARRLDQNDDGQPDTWDEYEGGRAVTRERDRDDDGVRDVFYLYEHEALARESHDADNDGRIDLVIHYARGRRDRSEEDVDRDGRMDTWTTYVIDDGREHERIGRKERDRLGDGAPDTVEVFGFEEGQAVLERREEDKNGDGRADIVSFFVGGKLRRRQILDPDA